MNTKDNLLKVLQYWATGDVLSETLLNAMDARTRELIAEVPAAKPATPQRRYKSSAPQPREPGGDCDADTMSDAEIGGVTWCRKCGRAPGGCNCLPVAPPRRPQNASTVAVPSPTMPERPDVADTVPVMPSRVWCTESGGGMGTWYENIEYDCTEYVRADAVSTLVAADGPGSVAYRFARIGDWAGKLYGIDRMSSIPFEVPMKAAAERDAGLRERIEAVLRVHSDLVRVSELRAALSPEGVKKC